MDIKIVEIAGKTYLELPCRPGTRVWYVGYAVDRSDSGQIKLGYKVFNWNMNLRDLLCNLHRIGNTLFLTKEEAEEYMRKVEAGECTL